MTFSNQNNQFVEMNNHIDKARRFGRFPLFILGAGVSSGKVPLMSEIFEVLGDMLDNASKSQADSPSIKAFKGLTEDAKRLARDVLYQSRAIASKFFGIMQENEEYKEIWRKFTHKFLIGLGDKDPILSLAPSPFHEFVARHIVEGCPPATCVSLNYDGLTAKAVAQYAIKQGLLKEIKTSLDPLFPCRILTTAAEIQNYYCRNVLFNSKSRFYPLIKLRGDIFNAVCENEDCKYYGQRTPIYEIAPIEAENLTKPKDDVISRSGKDEKPTLWRNDAELETKVKRLLSCKGCSNERKVEIDFPGYRTKEKEVSEVLEMLYQYIIPSISCVIVCGVSGKWDPELIAFIKACAEIRDVSIYCIDREPQPPLKTELNLQGEQKKYLNIVSIDFEQFKE